MTNNETITKTNSNTNSNTNNKATNTRKALIIFSVVTVALITMATFHGADVQIDGDEVSGVGGFFAAVIACGIGALAVFFALSLTGLILAGVAALLCVVFVCVLGSVALALLPLLLPVLLIVGLVALFSRRKTV